MPLPYSMVNALAMLPSDRTVSVIMRHGNRYPIVDEATGHLVELTPEGVALAEDYGQMLSLLRQPGRLLASPVGRCEHTARAIAQGARWNLPVFIDERLGFPYVEPAWRAMKNGWQPGDALPEPVNGAVELALENDLGPGGLNVYVSHDSNVICLVHFLLGEPVMGDDWPAFFEGLFFWREGDSGLHILWREKVYQFEWDQRTWGISKYPAAGINGIINPYFQKRELSITDKSQ